MSRVAELVHRGDLDELVRAVDAAAARTDFDEVVALRRACLEAVEQSGRQLWGPAAYAAYRLVLDAPSSLAVETMLAASDRHTLGPLTEVVAQSHDWDELAGLLPPGPVAGTVAVERVLRGEDLSGDPRAETNHLDLPAVHLPWEGPRPHVDYRAHEVLAPAPVVTPIGPFRPASTAGAVVDDDELATAWTDLVAPWTAGPDGRVDVVVVDGPATAAVGALARRAELAPIGLSDAVAWLCWAAASGGSSQRRRGGAAGRSATWWALRLLTDHEPGSAPDLLRDHLAEWDWYAFDGPDHDGWWLRLAAGHPDGWSIAIDAHDPPGDETVLDASDPPESVEATSPGGTRTTDPWADLDRAIVAITGDDPPPADNAR